MSRILIDMLARALEAAYRTDRWHSLRNNLSAVKADEWDIKPANHRVEVFGTEPELSIADLVAHVGAAKRMYANHAFGDGKATWASLAPLSREMESLLAWLEDGHALLRAGLLGLPDDEGLRAERLTHWGQALPVERFVSILINHDLYHSGEINRQLTLIRGAEGWSQHDPDSVRG